MLEQNDLIAIRKIMKEEIAESEKRTDARFAESENLILEKEIAAVQKNLDELSQYYKITKLENDNTALLLKMIDELSRRIEKLEKKTA